MSEDTRILINAGGRVFETSTTTLKLSGAGYFEALLGDTGTQMRGRKRARPGDDAPEVTGSAEDDAPGAPREIFIDRDPDVFADVLRYMRSDRLPAAAAKDEDRLEDLKAEAEFLCYDALSMACDAAIDAMRAAEAAAAAAAAAKVIPEARNLIIETQAETDDYGDDASIHVPKGQVLYVVSAMLIISQPLQDLFNAQRRHKGAFLRLEACGKPMILVQHWLKSELGGFDVMHGIRLCFSGGEEEEVKLSSYGLNFQINAWVGHPSKIPGLAHAQAQLSA
ncbi:unnamed protein product [Pelagomonas calceolata]|uniref:BTB domain-containing protein n=1 Tax=Pelagomonas calceolata TaxID=35677 RepID=A0A7S3ZY91_9STRA|nr:unnamed protein product [Pelagomonas calceolata]|mmetsp:Transcript_5687/g.15963  ORF Transcript_5687/g.15963 Transcript_5687/m.15963 type:complete len:280 (-) Transcript_5687:8-847(-)